MYNTYAGKSNLQIFRQLKFTLFIPDSPPKVFPAYLSTTLFLLFFCPVQKKGNNAFDRAVCSVLSPLPLHVWSFCISTLNWICSVSGSGDPGVASRWAGGGRGRERAERGGGRGRGKVSLNYITFLIFFPWQDFRVIADLFASIAECTGLIFSQKQSSHKMCTNIPDFW